MAEGGCRTAASRAPRERGVRLEHSPQLGQGACGHSYILPKRENVLQVWQGQNVQSTQRAAVTQLQCHISPTRGSSFLLCNTFAEDKNGEKVTMIRLIKLQAAYRIAWG